MIFKFFLFHIFLFLKSFAFGEPVVTDHNRPVIVLPVSVKAEEERRSGKRERMLRYGMLRYEAALENEGATVIRVSLLNTPDEIKAALQKADGIVIPGGQDIDPSMYNEAPTHIDPHQTSDIAFDRFQLQIIDEAFHSKKPMLGICRGSQLINVFLGGTLVQDLPTQYTGLQYDHLARNSGEAVYVEHPAIIERDSKLFQMIGNESISINSYHHQAWKDMGRGLKVVARSPDKVPEAFEYMGDQIIWGTQFHPEIHVYENPKSPFRKIFQKVVETAKNYKKMIPLKTRIPLLCTSGIRAKSISLVGLGN